MKLIVIAVLLIVGVSIPMRKKENSKCKIEGIVVPIGTTMPIVMFSFTGQRQKIFLTVMNKSINNHLIVICFQNKNLYLLHHKNGHLH